MIPPLFISISELADRWSQPPRQLIEHALVGRLKLFFPFSGLAFPLDEIWLRHGGDNLKRRELASLLDAIKGSREQITRNAQGRAGQFDSLSPLGLEEASANIEKWAIEANDLDRVLEAREFERRSYSMRGYLLALPGYLWELQGAEETPFPDRALHPSEPQFLALEPGIGGEWKQTLNRSDLLASFGEVEALESGNARGTTPAPIQRSQAQEMAILQALRTLGHDPAKLPKSPPGKPGARLQAWLAVSSQKDLFQSKRVFDKAWERLGASRDILYVPSSP